MKTIKIFLASSINEFSDERFALKDFKRRLNDVLVDNDIFVKLFICECASNEMGAGRKQDEYNDEINESDVFIIIVGEKLGGYTFEEYDHALKVKDKKPHTKIIAAFKDMPENAIDEAVADFREKSNNEDEVEQVVFKTLGDLKKVLVEAIAEKLDGIVKMHVADNAVIIRNKDGEAITAAKL